MDTVCTPKSTMSSVFFTPPFSSERSHQEACNGLNPRIPLPNFLNLTPERAQQEERVDIVSRLSGSYLQISFYILSHLEPCDLSTCLAVSKSWRSIILFHKSFKDRIKNYRIEKRKDQENMYMKQLGSPPLTPRHPLSTRVTHPNSTTTIPRSYPVAEITRSKEALRPCPQCSSPRAKNIDKSRSLCDVCHYDFCPKCFKPTHINHTCSAAISPKKRHSDNSVACGSKSKRRLRRL